MAGSFRFLHCGDVHLGAGRQVHAERYLDLFRVFEEVTEAAHDPDVNALLISGDLFDVKEPDVETLARAVAVFQALRAARPDLLVLAIEGNHDMRKRARASFRNERGVLDILGAAGLLTLLRPEQTADDGLDFSNATYLLPEHDLAVVGLGYWREDVPTRFRQAMDYISSTLSETRVIVLAHFMVMREGMDPYHGSAHLSELLPVADNVKYVGLGHGHSRIDSDSSLHGGVFYSPGSLEFVHARNTHKPVDTRGYFDVTVGEERAVAQHKPTLQKRPFLHLKIDVGREQAENFEALRKAVLTRFRRALGEVDRPPILSVLLEGQISFPAVSFRTSLIQRDLVDELGAIQAFARRGELEDATGLRVGVEARGGYEDAIITVLDELMTNARGALGLDEDDDRLSQLLLEAIRDDSEMEQVLEDCARYLEDKRTVAVTDCVAEVDVSGLTAAGVQGEACPKQLGTYSGGG